MSSCCHKKKKIDYLLWSSLFGVFLLYFSHLIFADKISFYHFSTLSLSVFELVNRMWWGVLIGMFMVAFLAKIPREFIISILGKGGSFSGILRATAAGVLLDLCSHGILMVGSKLYQRGASIGQVMAFLIASPWNSFSLTLILIALIGLKWTLLFILFSMLIAILTGVLFDKLVKRKVLPENPNNIDLVEDFAFFTEARNAFKKVKFNFVFFKEICRLGVTESRMVMRWILFGIILASLVRTSISVEHFQTFFAPTIAGLGLTIIAATIIEVCSEGSTPIAADILTRAHAPGNSFAFLMTGVSTDYTEIMVLKDTTKSWKISLFLPLLTVPQIIFIASIMNGF